MIALTIVFGIRQNQSDASQSPGVFEQPAQLGAIIVGSATRHLGENQTPLDSTDIVHLSQ